MTTPASRAARILLDIGAVNFRPEAPFTLTSGALSPVYIDCRRVIAFLPERREITAMAAELLSKSCDMGAVDYVAGGETAGIPYAAWISDALSKPMLYIRKKPKGFGRGAQIEGHMPEGARVLLVEDLATDGGSKVAFANAIRDGGGTVSDVFSVFFYGIYPRASKILSDAGLSLHSLTTWKDVLAEARRSSPFAPAALDEVERFLNDPEGWAAKAAEKAARA